MLVADAQRRCAPRDEFGHNPHTQNASWINAALLIGDLTRVHIMGMGRIEIEGEPTSEDGGKKRVRNVKRDQ